MDNDEIIKVIIKGKDNEAVPLLSVTEALKEFHHTIDKSYLSLTGKEKLYKSDRERYKIVASDIRTGSITADLVIVLPPAVQAALAFQTVTTGLTVKTVWELTKTSFSFLKAIAELRHKGTKPSIVQHDNPHGLNIISQGGNVTINVGDLVSHNALRSESNIKNLARIVDERSISSFSALDNVKDGIILTPKENKIFNPETFIDKIPIEIIGKIYRLDVETKTGRLRVLEGEYKGEYSFQIIGKQQIASYIHALGHKSSKVTALKEIIKHPTGEETLAGFQVVDIASEGGRLFE